VGLVASATKSFISFVVFLSLTHFAPTFSREYIRLYITSIFSTVPYIEEKKQDDKQEYNLHNVGNGGNGGWKPTLRIRELKKNEKSRIKENSTFQPPLPPLPTLCKRFPPTRSISFFVM